MTNIDRREAMAVSLDRAVRAAGLSREASESVGQAFSLAMRPRQGTLDEHDPAFLHPGRTVLVLLQDVGPLDVSLLVAAAVHESEAPLMRVPLEEIRGDFGDRVARLIERIPLPGTDALVERLVTLDEPTRLVALAERLDHLRHAHLREDPVLWRSLEEEVRVAWGPVAERTHPRLADRYRAWTRAMGRRLGGTLRRAAR